MPKTLFSELQKLADRNHYLDVSEQVRSIVRDRWKESKDPQAYQLKKLRKDIAEAVKTKNDTQAQQQLIKELERIKEGLISEGNR